MIKDNRSPERTKKKKLSQFIKKAEIVEKSHIKFVHFAKTIERTVRS